MGIAIDSLDPGRVRCATVDINPRKLDQRDHDFLHATTLAIRAVRGENRGIYNEEMADMHYLAGLCDLAAGKSEHARAQFACAAHHGGYNPEPRFGTGGRLGSPFLDHEWRDFRDNHVRFNYAGALEMFREEQSKITLNKKTSKDI